MQHLKRNWLFISKLTPQFDEFLPELSNISKLCTLMDSFWPKYIMFEIKKYRRIMFHGTEGWRKIWRKLTCAFQYDMRNLTNIHRLKAIILSSDFILESKMAQLNQIKNSKQLDRPDAVRKLYFAFEIKE